MGLFRLSLCVKMGYSPNIFLLMPKTIWDVDALAFISNHEANTGVSMGSTQKLAINNLYKRLKGNGTTNGSNLLAMAVTNGARLFPLCPINNTTANALAYELDMVSNGVNKGVYNNFVSGDFTPAGATGGVTKWFDTGKNATNFSLTNVSHWVYSRTNSNVVMVEIGTNARTMLYIRISNTISVRINDVSTQTVANTDSRGFFGISRNGTTKYCIKNGVKSTVGTVATTSSSTPIAFHASNSAGVAANESSRQLSFYIVGLSDLTQNEIDDLYYCVQQYQTEVITGGRQV